MDIQSGKNLKAVKESPGNKKLLFSSLSIQTDLAENLC